MMGLSFDEGPLPEKKNYKQGIALSIDTVVRQCSISAPSTTLGPTYVHFLLRMVEDGLQLSGLAQD
jgi:hypothetical protein